MSTALKQLIKRNHERKLFLSNGNSIADYDVNIKVKSPPSEKNINKTYGEPDQCFIIIPDVHSYERDKKSVKLLMRAAEVLGKRYNVTKVVQLGDLLECGIISSHGTSSVTENVPLYSEEVEWAVNDFWNPLMKSCPSANYYALLGNHENRLDKWLVKTMGKSELSAQIFNDYLPTKLYEEMGIHVTPYARENIPENILTLFPGLICIHGWSTAANAAKAHGDALYGGHSIIFGHTHRMQSDVRRHPLTNKYIRSYSFGSLAKVSMKWHGGNPMNHTLGFGLVFTYGDEFVVKTQEILMNGDNRILFLDGCGVLEE